MLIDCEKIIWIFLVTYTLGCQVRQTSLQPDWIVDQAEILEVEDESSLHRRLSDFYDSTSVALVGVTLKSIPQEPIEFYTESLYHSWELGNPDTHNGIMVLLEISEPRLEITLGSGIAQEFSSVVLDSVKMRMAEQFDAGDYRIGFEIGFDMLMRRASALPWAIAYTSLAAAERDSVNNMDQIVSTEGRITGFEEDLVIVTDSEGYQVRLMVPVDPPILSMEDFIGFTGRIVNSSPIRIRVLNLEVDFAM